LYNTTDINKFNKVMETDIFSFALRATLTVSNVVFALEDQLA